MPGGKMGQGWKFSFNGGLVQSKSDYPTPTLILVQNSNTPFKIKLGQIWATLCYDA